MARVTLDKWLVEALNDQDKEGPCTAITLMHQLGMGTEEVHGVKLGRSIDPNDLAQLLFHKAKTRVQDIPGSQLFFVFAFYGNRNEPQAKFPFRIDVDSQNAYGTTEPPTEQGQRQQGMRFTEVAFKNQQFTIERQQSMIELLMRNNIQAVDSMMAAAELAQKAILSIEDRKHEQRLKELEFMRSSEERKQLMKYAPVIANTLLPGVIPVESSDSALVELFIDKASSNPGLIQKLAEILPPEIMGPLAARAEKYLEEKNNAEKTAALALNGHDSEVLQ